MRMEGRDVFRRDVELKASQGKGLESVRVLRVHVDVKKLLKHVSIDDLSSSVSVDDSRIP